MTFRAMKRKNIIWFVICVDIFYFWSSTQATLINLEDSMNEETELPGSRANLIDASKFDIEKFVNGLGYHFEKHTITTEDGYNLEMHRIPRGKNVSSSAPANSPPVLMMHGILGTSADFLISGPENSLALQLADQGYDVWLGNNRGNTYSRSHYTMSPSNKSFWNFSFHELGVYDDTAMIDYIYNISQKTNISCLGYSQGATQFFAMLSEKPEYNKKLTVLFTMAPLVFMKNSDNNIFRLMADHYDTVEKIEKKLDISEFLSHDPIFTSAGDLFCKKSSDYRRVCAAITSNLLGFQKKHVSGSMLENLWKVFPGGSSFKEFKHYAQLISSGKFRKYDYGSDNTNIYHNETPPEYDLQQIETPVGVYWAENDGILNVIDKKRFLLHIYKVVVDRGVHSEIFNHGDFVFNGQAASLLNYWVINDLNEHNNKIDITTTREPTSSSSSISSTTAESTTHHGSSSRSLSPSLFILVITILFTSTRVLMTS
nr:lipase 3-like [Leptinotarsa decemlineata]